MRETTTTSELTQPSLSVFWQVWAVVAFGMAAVGIGYFAPAVLTIGMVMLLPLWAASLRFNRATWRTQLMEAVGTGLIASWPSALVWLFAFAGMAWTNYAHRGWNTVTVQLPMLLVPMVVFSMGRLPAQVIAWIERVAAAVAVSLAVVAVYAMLTINMSQHPYGVTRYDVLPTNNPIYAGLYVAMVVMVWGERLVSNPKAISGLSRALQAVIPMGLLVFLAVLSSRGALLALAGGWVVRSVMLASHSPKGGRAWLRVLGAIAVILMAGVTAYFVSPYLAASLDGMVDDTFAAFDDTVTRERLNSTTERLGFWRAATAALMQAPMSPLLGWGTAGQFIFTEEYYLRNLPWLPRWAFGGMSAHSQFLETAAQHGLLGLGALVGWLIFYGKKAWSTCNPDGVAVVTALTIAMLTESFLQRQIGVAIATMLIPFVLRYGKRLA